ncbi:hypothetical protein ACFWN2_04610 [Lentzea sp. NPDC058436]|uniref:hypothetical protein n=1 Tax=Lentzea sp. NPDC058436 TaxID=3346499 RepID=UPI0036658A45
MTDTTTDPDTGAKGFGLRALAAQGIPTPPTFPVPLNPVGGSGCPPVPPGSGGYIVRASPVVDFAVLPLLSGLYDSVRIERFEDLPPAVEQIRQSAMDEAVRTRLDEHRLPPPRVVELLQPYFTALISGIAHVDPRRGIRTAWREGNLEPLAGGHAAGELQCVLPYTGIVRGPADDSDRIAWWSDRIALAFTELAKLRTSMQVLEVEWLVDLRGRFYGLQAQPLLDDGMRDDW